MNKLDW